MRDRIIKLSKPVAVVAAIGFIYLLLHELTGFAVPCPINLVTGLYCPGCGISRMFFCLFRLDFAGAFSSNCVIFCLLPVAVIAAVFHAYRYIRYGSGRLYKAENIAIYVIIAVLVIFGIARNIWHADWLIP